MFRTGTKVTVRLISSYRYYIANLAEEQFVENPKKQYFVEFQLFNCRFKV